jgi:FtsP/CotA-like multicopper oxidase with cupredoxin domain
VRNSIKVAIAAVATLAILGPIGYLWQDSLVPSTYDMAAMGYADFGGGQAAGHDHGNGGISVASLTGPTTGTPEVTVTLTARRENGGYTLNHTTPGPEIDAVRGQLVQVTLVNENVPDGVTLHWHGVDVPNAEDGVAGITQDAVRPGQSHVYRFVAQDAGTYWYHSHQVSHEQVRLGLFGAFVVTDPPVPATLKPAARQAAQPNAGQAAQPNAGQAAQPNTGQAAQPNARRAAQPHTGQAAEPSAGQADIDQVVLVHTYKGRRTVNGAAGVSPLAAAPGKVVRARIVNTDAGPIRAWVSGAAYRIVAVDGRDVHGPADVSGKAFVVTAGGRIDVRFAVPGNGAARVDVGAGAALATGQTPAPAEPQATVDLLSYGTPAPLGFDRAKANRTFQYRIGRRLGFLDGKPGMWWTINGHLFPDVPMFMVATGDVVRMTITNSSGEVHPMHLHGHHAVVLSRNGAAATGSPWWIDSLDVGDNETYEIAFVADNPGIWVDHCHNLQHAVDGLLAHLTYTNVTTPYRVGGKAGNSPE